MAHQDPNPAIDRVRECMRRLNTLQREVVVLVATYEFLETANVRSALVDAVRLGAALRERRADR